VRELQVAGQLTLHGQTRTIAFQAYLALEDGDVHVVGDVEIKQTDFGIEPVSAGLGTVKVKDEVTIAFDVWAVEEDTPAVE
jgi:polyisoprenoid-binding protein YceI